jgi:hypothetical protein
VHGDGRILAPPDFLVRYLFVFLWCVEQQKML